MNTKKTIVALAIAMAVAFVASVGMASAATLYAGQDIPVGTVTVSPDGTTITYDTTGSGWVMNETHLHVATTLGAIPQNKNNNPIPGHFDYSTVHDPPVTTYPYNIPALPVTPLYIAAHAEVARLVDGVWQEESAWAGTEVGEKPFAGKNWATYFVFSPVEKYASKEYVKAGEKVLYRVVVINYDGSSPLKMMEVKETMQTGEMSYDVGSCSLLTSNTKVVETKEIVTKSGESKTTWTAMDAGVRIPVLEIAPGESTEFILTATIDQDAVKGQILRNVIEVIVQRAGGVGFTHTAEAVVVVEP